MALVRNLLHHHASTGNAGKCAWYADRWASHSRRTLWCRFSIWPHTRKFRYYKTIQPLSESARITMMALDYAIDTALCNVPQFDGRTLVALDTSGSMEETFWNRLALCSSVVQTEQCRFAHFQQSSTVPAYNPLDSVLSIAQGIPFSSGGTNFNAILNTSLLRTRMVILSDMQGWMNNLGSLDSGGAPQKHLLPTKFAPMLRESIFVRPARLRNADVSWSRMCIVWQGFRKKFFDVMRLMEQDRNALIHAVEGGRNSKTKYPFVRLLTLYVHWCKSLTFYRKEITYGLLQLCTSFASTPTEN